MTGRRGAAAVVMAMLAVMAGAGCGGASSTGTNTSASSASGPAPSSPQPYSSQAFVVPLTVTPDPSLKSPPDDSSHLLTWDSTTSDEEKVRFLVPVVTYFPGMGTPVPPPADFVGYLHSETKNGFILSEESTTTVDGRPAILLTATSNLIDGHEQGFFDASLGCPSADAETEEECFGLQPQYTLRLAVLTVNGSPMLAWARVGAGHTDAAFFSGFEKMLQTVHFR